MSDGRFSNPDAVEVDDRFGDGGGVAETWVWRGGGFLRVTGRVQLPLSMRARLRFPGLSLGGAHLLVEGVWVGLLVFDSVEVLAVEFGEGGAVAGVAEEQVEHGPDE